MARFPTGVVIVGGSAAGLSAADGLREGGYDGSIIVLDENLEPGFDRPMLSKGLVAAGEGAKPLPLRSAERLAENQITVHPGHRAVGLDIDRRLIVTTYGEAIPWESVIIATGVDARRLYTTAGNPLPALRNLADLEAVQSMVARQQELTLVGGGFIGLEVASALASTDLDVTVLCPNPLPLVRTLGPQTSTWLRDLHLARGVDLRLSSTVTSVEENPEGYLLNLADGQQHTSAAVLAGVGVEPATDWLLGSGVDLGGGVLVDSSGRTNVPGVWAVGDIASSPDPDTGTHCRFEHWTHAIETGRHVGLNVARNEAEPFEGVPYVWTEQFERTLHVFGRRRPDDEETLVQGSFEAGEFVVLHGTGNQLHAVTISGFPTATRTYKRLLRARATLADARAAASPA